VDCIIGLGLTHLLVRTRARKVVMSTLDSRCNRLLRFAFPPANAAYRLRATDSKVG
jgi:hypothetical protein